MWELNHKEGWATRNWCFQNVLMEKTLKVPWIARSNQSSLKKINLEHELEVLMLKLKLGYSGYLMWRADSLEKTLILGKIEVKRRKGQRMRRWDSITHSKDMNLGKSGDIGGQRSLASCSPKSQTGLSDWIITTIFNLPKLSSACCRRLNYIF